MHDHWSLFKSYPLKERFLFWKIHRKRKGGDHGVHQEIYNIKRQSFKTWKSFGMETKWLYNYRRINKSSEQMIYYDSYQVLKFLRKVLILQIKTFEL